MKKTSDFLHSFPLFIPAFAFSFGILAAALLRSFLISQTEWNRMVTSTSNWLVAYVVFLVCMTSYRRFLVLIGIGFIAAGFLFGNIRYYREADHIAHIETPGQVELWGRVVAFGRHVSHGRKTVDSFTLSANQIFTAGRRKKTSGLVFVTLINAGWQPKPGDSLRIRGLLESPRIRTSPGQLDYSVYLAQRQIFRTLFAVGGRNAKKINDAEKQTFPIWIEAVRLRLHERIESLFPFPENQLASALLLGIRNNIPLTIRNIFIKTGTAHLLAISGLNISIIAGFLYFSLRSLRFLSRKVRALIVFAFTVIYVFIGGGGPPVMRAGLMAAIVLAGIMLEKESNLLNGLLVAFFILLVCAPSDFFSPSFQLSFLAVFSLGIGLMPDKKSNQSIQQTR